MSYTVEYTDLAYKNLKKLDKYTRKLILSWIHKNLVGCSNPCQHGKGLLGNKSEQWRYRVGDYRIICDIQDDKILVLVLEIGHRREIYK